MAIYGICLYVQMGLVRITRVTYPTHKLPLRDAITGGDFCAVFFHMHEAYFGFLIVTCNDQVITARVFSIHFWWFVIHEGSYHFLYCALTGAIYIRTIDMVLRQFRYRG